MKNKELAAMFSEMADILEITGEVIFKVNAYRKASRVLDELLEDITRIHSEGKLHDLTGIGKAIAAKIEEYLATGDMRKFNEVKAMVPPSVVSLLEIQGLGPKTVGMAHKRLGVQSLDDLKRAIADGSLEKLPGMGAKKIGGIRRGIELFESGHKRVFLYDAICIADDIITQLKATFGNEIGRISPAGSTRRMRETVRDIDILVETDQGEAVVAAFTRLPLAKAVLAAGATKGSIVTASGVQVDLRAVPTASFGAAQQYFTGSKAHNVKLRGIARTHNFKINEYGIYEGERKLGGESEEDIYRILGLTWIPSELREDRGEIECAASGCLPQLIDYGEIKGDLHVHSNKSDGHLSIARMSEAAVKLGYQYLAICDHSKSAAYARGLSPEALLDSIAEIKALNEKFSNFRILAGTEVDILSDGNLDYDDELLAQLDFVVASIHSAFTQNPTGRIIKAIENPHVDMIGHLSGRLLGKRDGYAVDYERIFEAARQTNTLIEINAQPMRFDLDDIHARRAAESGIKLAIISDAHDAVQLQYMKTGIGIARRAWLTKQDVLNTAPVEQILS
ncbi:DNA polymerase/3'-5' exonuclease PolX [candidate division KSB1 bacterium]|nr:DNA polymerase/3'-5' exonuclease PolX [candidate division KSB1 bacterium]